MTNINDIADLEQILQDHPEWRDTIRGLIVGEELANLPQDLATFIEATNENFKLVHQRLERLEKDVTDAKTDDMTEIRNSLEYVKGRMVSAETNKNAAVIEMGMGVGIMTLGGAMFLLPMITMIPAHLILGGVPDPMLTIGGWSMVFGVLVGAIGAFFTLNGA